MSQKINFLVLFVINKLEFILGSAAGITVLAFNIEEILVRLALAFVFGLAGACGAYVFKRFISKEIKDLNQK